MPRPEDVGIKRVLNKAANVVMEAFEKANIETDSMLILTMKAKAGRYSPHPLPFLVLGAFGTYLS